MDNDNNQLNEDIDHVAKEHSSDQLNIYLPTIISTSVERVGAVQVLNLTPGTSTMSFESTSRYRSSCTIGVDHADGWQSTTRDVRIKDRTVSEQINKCISEQLNK